MGLPTLTKDNVAFELPPAGTQPAAVVGVIDLGTHTRKYKDEKTGKDKLKPNREIFLVFELRKRRTDGTPFVVGRAYTYSISDKAALTPVLTSLYGGDPQEMISEDGLAADLPGRNCLVDIQHKKGTGNNANKTFANVKGVMASPEGIPAFTPEMGPVTFELGQPEPNWEELTWLPRIFGKTVEEVIAASHEAGGS